MMKPIHSKSVTWILATFIFLILAWTFLFTRMGSLLLSVLLIIAVCYPRWRRWAMLAPLVLLWGMASFGPWDISFENRPGPPHFARYAMGLPGPEAIEASKRGEVVFGGCMSTGFEPKYVWVW